MTNNSSEKQRLDLDVIEREVAALRTARRGRGPMLVEDVKALIAEAENTRSIICWSKLVYSEDGLIVRRWYSSAIPTEVITYPTLRWVLVTEPQTSPIFPVVNGVLIAHADDLPAHLWDRQSPSPYVATGLAAEETPAKVGFDAVEYPAHYNQGDIECVDAVRSQLSPEEFRGGCKQQAMQYIARERMKGGDQDLRKAIWWLRMAVGDDPRSYRKPPSTTP